MLIAIDIDAVMADLLSMFLKYRNHKYGTKWRRDEFFTYEWYKVFEEPKDEMYKILYDFFHSEFMARIEPMPGAIVGVRHLHKSHKLDVITSRPRIIEAETRAWLDLYFPHTFEKIYFSNQPAFNSFGRHKGEICSDIDADLFIDDQYGYGVECAGKGILVFLFDNPWNQGVVLPPNMTRVHDWNEILKNVNSIDEVKSNNDKAFSFSSERTRGE